MNLECKAGALVLAATTFAACGGPERTQAPPPSSAVAARAAPAAAPPAAASIDTCQLLTKQEVEAALGKAVGEGVPEKTPPVFACRWPAPSGLESAGLSVVVFDSPAQALAAFEMAVKINNYDQVSGIGDRAYASTVYDLTVLKGRYELSVDVSLLQGDQRAVARRLAEQAVPRLPL